MPQGRLCLFSCVSMATYHLPASEPDGISIMFKTCRPRSPIASLQQTITSQCLCPTTSVRSRPVVFTLQSLFPTMIRELSVELQQSLDRECVTVSRCETLSGTPSDLFIDYSGWFELPFSIVWARQSNDGLTRHLRRSIHCGAGGLMYRGDSEEQLDAQMLFADHEGILLRTHPRC
jgi:hypothetical protein